MVMSELLNSVSRFWLELMYLSFSVRMESSFIQLPVGRFHRCCTGQSEANFLLKYMCQIEKNIF